MVHFPLLCQFTGVYLHRFHGFQTKNSEPPVFWRKPVHGLFWSHEFPISEAGGRNSNRHGQKSTKKNGCLDMFGVLFLVRETRKKKQWIFIATMAFTLADWPSPCFQWVCWFYLLAFFKIFETSLETEKHLKISRFRKSWGNPFNHRTATGLGVLTVSH